MQKRLKKTKAKAGMKKKSCAAKVVPAGKSSVLGSGTKRIVKTPAKRGTIPLTTIRKAIESVVAEEQSSLI